MKAVGVHHQGSIPAWAGETSAGRPIEGCRFQGLSPRGRGKPGRRLSPPAPLRSIPAWAGETADRLPPYGGGKVYPRVGGGNVLAGFLAMALQGLSPRGRGKLLLGIARILTTGSIPAWAGETRIAPHSFRFPPVYPRVGGGNPGRRSNPPLLYGLSPRGRGKRREANPETKCWRSIPAWAGETRKINPLPSAV